MPHEGVCPTTALPTTPLEPSAAEQPMSRTHVSGRGSEGVGCCDGHVCYALSQILMDLMVQVELKWSVSQLVQMAM